jgi:3-phosphoshikimate 1-carboxyvinyltransferase
MKLIVNKTEKLNGTARVPPSKSHTHRAIILASLASGISQINNPLKGEDCISTIKACQQIGAKIDTNDYGLEINGVHGKPQTPQNIIDVGNSGTTLRLMSAVVAHCKGKVILTGDESIQKRPIESLLNALNDLGAKATSLNGTGRPPVEIQGLLKGGNTKIQGISSQFISGLLITCSLAQFDSTIQVVDLKSKPYIDMTIQHLKQCGVQIQHDDYKIFSIPKNQYIQPRKFTVPADFSSAAFLLSAANITHSTIEVDGLDFNDVQGDKVILDIIKKMNSDKIREIDLGNSPDLLPVTAVLACYAKGMTIIKNVEHARMKESDRIRAMSLELHKLGANIEERADGLIIKESALSGAKVNGYMDHRIVMALAVAGLGANGTTEINNAESITVSYPGFVKTMQKLKANIDVEEE